MTPAFLGRRYVMRLLLIDVTIRVVALLTISLCFSNATTPISIMLSADLST